MGKYHLHGAFDFAKVAPKAYSDGRGRAIRNYTVVPKAAFTQERATSLGGP